MNTGTSYIRQYFQNMLPTLDEEQWGIFMDASDIRTYKKGDFLLRPGQIANTVGFVNQGLLRSYYLIDGKEFITVFFHENCYYSDYESFLSRQPTLQYTEVLEDCELVETSYDNIQNLYNRFPAFERAGRRVAEELFVLLSNRNSSFLMKTPEERYLEFLDQFPTLPQRVPQYMIASYLGVTPEALSRIRSRLARRPAARFIDQDQ